MASLTGDKQCIKLQDSWITLCSSAYLKLSQEFFCQLFGTNRHTNITVELRNPFQRYLHPVFSNVISLKKEL